MAILGLVMVVTAIWDLFLGISSSHCRHLTSLSQPAKCNEKCIGKPLKISISALYWIFSQAESWKNIFFIFKKLHILIRGRYILRIKKLTKKGQILLTKFYLYRFNYHVWFNYLIWMMICICKYINETLPKQNSTKIHVLFEVPTYRKKILLGYWTRDGKMGFG